MDKKKVDWDIFIDNFTFIFGAVVLDLVIYIFGWVNKVILVITLLIYFIFCTISFINIFIYNFFIFFFVIIVFFFYFFFLKFIIRLNPIYLKNHILFKIQVFKKLANNKTKLVSSLGYYDTNPKFKIIIIKTELLGYWLNKGASINISVFKLIKRYICQF